MDESKALAFAKAHTPGLTRLLGVDDWWVTVNFGPTKTESNAEIVLETPYKQAAVTVDLRRYADDEHEKLYRTLRHELIHLLFGEYDILERAVRQVIGDDKTAMAALDLLAHHADERAVLAVEAILDHLCPIPEMITRTKCQSSQPPKRKR